jgi:predicted ATPase
LTLTKAKDAQMVALTRVSPVLMIFEDVHWMDPTSLEALDRIVDHIRTACVLLIVTFRPEFDPPWIGRPYVTALTINRLDQRDIDAMIEHLVGNEGLPASIRQDIIERTDGIPLFVEEMTKAVLEARRRMRPTVPCKVYGREFTPDTEDTDLIEWIFRDEGIECPYCGSCCPID